MALLKDAAAEELENSATVTEMMMERRNSYERLGLPFRNQRPGNEGDRGLQKARGHMGEPGKKLYEKAIEHIENYWKYWKQNGKREYKLSEVGAPGLLLRRALDGNKSLALGVAQV